MDSKMSEIGTVEEPSVLESLKFYSSYSFLFTVASYVL